MPGAGGAITFLCNVDGDGYEAAKTTGAEGNGGGPFWWDPAAPAWTGCLARPMASGSQQRRAGEADQECLDFVRRALDPELQELFWRTVTAADTSEPGVRTYPEFQQLHITPLRVKLDMPGLHGVTVRAIENGLARHHEMGRCEDGGCSTFAADLGDGSNDGVGAGEASRAGGPAALGKALLALLARLGRFAGYFPPVLRNNFKTPPHMLQLGYSSLGRSFFRSKRPEQEHSRTAKK